MTRKTTKTKKTTKPPRCEGWTRHGGIFSLGPVTWTQCTSLATVMLTVRQPPEGGGPLKTSKQPACRACWQKCIENGIKITKVVPIEETKQQ